MVVDTSVGEEGLDFPACALVIRYDVNSTMIGYLQSRGRARRKESEYVVLADKYDPNQLEAYRVSVANTVELYHCSCLSLQKYVEYEDLMAQQYRGAQLKKAPTYHEQEIGIHPQDQALRQHYRVQSTGALLTFERAISLINEACSLLPTSDGIPPPSPITDVEEISQNIYRARILLPAATSLPKHRLAIEARPRRTKMEAKHAAAFEACKVLHRYGQLNNYLLPHREPEGEEAVDIDGRLVGKDLDVESEIKVDLVWGNMWKSITNTVYLTPLSIDGKVLLGLISGAPLPRPVEFTMWSGKCAEEKTRTAVCGKSIPLEYTPQQAHDLFYPYTQRAYNEVIAFGKVLGMQLALLLAPLQQSGEINHDILERVFDPVPEDPDRLNIAANGPYGRPYAIDRTRTDISLQSLAKDVLVRSASIDRSDLPMDMTYRDWLRKKYGNSTLLMETLDDGLPLIEATRVSKRRNNLISAHDAIKGTNVFAKTKGPTSEILPQSWLTASFFDSESFDHLQVCSICNPLTRRRWLLTPNTDGSLRH